MARAPWADPGVYEVAARWVDECLREDGSLFTPGGPIWTREHALALDERVTPPPPITGSFEEKLRWQVGPLTSPQRQYAAELLYMLLLPDGSTYAPRSREIIGIALEGVSPAITIPTELEEALEASHRVADYGPGKNRRPDHLKLFAQWVAGWKQLGDEERANLLVAPWAFRDFIDRYRTGAGGMQVEAILHLAFPDVFEYALAPENKQKIATAFGGLPAVQTAENVDRKLLAIREATTPVFGREINLYADATRRLWTQTGSRAWDEFVHWTARLFETPGFDVAERDDKIVVAENLRAARDRADSEDPEWVSALKAAFGPPSELIDWRARDRFLDWCSANTPEARRLLAQLWANGLDGLEGFLEELPRGAVSGPGTRLSIASFLLLAVDALRLPVFRAQPYATAQKLLDLTEEELPVSDEIDLSRQYSPEDLAVRLGVSARSIRAFLREQFTRSEEKKGESWWPLTNEQVEAVVAQFGRKPLRADSLAGRYARFLALLDELLLRLIARGVPVRDRLDAQGLVWWVTSAKPPEQWDEEERGAFLAYQRGEGGDGPPRQRLDQHLVPAVTDSLVHRLTLDADWLQEIVDLLNEKGQVIFYGPPGTGKTYVAQELAAHATSSGGSWQLVQFHPAYTYEDFFEGYRPTPGNGGSLSFKLRNGPLRQLVDLAKDDEEHPYVLVIDEINRGNLPKIFGELYFLLEYRDRSIRLQYSPDDEFRLPENLFVIGTMNTADRSIALVDSALRRRFYFVEFSPVAGGSVAALLRSWLQEEHRSTTPADLLDELNKALTETPGAGEEFAVGPSYFMDDSGTPNVARVWQYAILPMLEERFYGALSRADLEARFGLDAIRARLMASAGEITTEQPSDATESTA